jgi:hypothetical protein
MDKELQTINTELIKFEDLIKDQMLQRIIVIQHYLKKKSVESLSKDFHINPIDLRFFLNSAEAFSIYKVVKEEFESAPRVESIEELNEALIDKLINFLHTCTPSEAADIVEKMIPQILNISMVIDKTNGSPISNRKAVESADYTVETALTGENYSVLQLEKIPPKLYSIEELESMTPPEKEEETE